MLFIKYIKLLFFLQKRYLNSDLSVMNQIK